MTFIQQLIALSEEAMLQLFAIERGTVSPAWGKTRKEFKGDYTLVVFPLVAHAKKSPEEVARLLGIFLKEKSTLVEDFNVVKGFLNVSLAPKVWFDFLSKLPPPAERFPERGSKFPVMVEYSSPNTNKPLHLGHVRNNLLGYAVSRILEAVGHEVIKTQIINDRGIHICKSMVAWQLFGNGETPEQSGLKGDKLVGKYYVIFDKEHRAQKEILKVEGIAEVDLDKTPIMRQAQEMLLRWEKNDPEVLQLWNTMNGWVYDGFEQTYQRLGVTFDKLYYESDTYIHGRDVVLNGVEKGVFEKQPDGSVWCDLTGDGLDRKLLLRSDGTSVYMTQDIGTALLRIADFPEVRQMIYTVGNEQDYHFNVLFKILKKLGYSWADSCYHLSYGMVDLPEGKMKSREGTVVDADDLMREMYENARAATLELGKLEDTCEKDRELLYEQVGMAALKYFILKVDPKKRMLFNPQESIDLNGNTGPFIQYTHARIKSILRKAGAFVCASDVEVDIGDPERDVIRSLYDFEEALHESARCYSPGVLVNYLYELARQFNSFYQSCPILNAPTDELRALRLGIAQQVAQTLAYGLSLLGIAAPERM
jgi:arginyl-tRNA synthetase